MILPIYAYGQPVLKRKAVPIEATYEGLQELIANMWETMDAAKGVGLAAPQIGLGIRLFVVDSTPMMEEGEEDQGIRQVLINAQMLDEQGNVWPYSEGCLSIPDISGEVERPSQIHIRYQDEHFATHEKTFDGMTARVIQHEYDHIEGKLFIEKLKPLKKKMIQRKLEKIKKGQVEARYVMRFV